MNKFCNTDVIRSKYQVEYECVCCKHVDIYSFVYKPTFKHKIVKKDADKKEKYLTFGEPFYYIKCTKCGIMVVNKIKNIY